MEGTVQRAGGRVRINAQLIDARTDSQLWAERYDRDIADVFAIESEVAGKIVAQLQAEISSAEKAAIGQKPTADLAAYDLYVRAKTLITTAVFSTPNEESLSEAVRLLNEAIERDPAFALAYYQLAHSHDHHLLRWYGSHSCAVGSGGCGDPIAHPLTSKFRRGASCSRQAFVLGLSRLRPRSERT